MKDSSATGPHARTTPAFAYHSDDMANVARWYLVDQAAHPSALRLLFEHETVPQYDLPYIHSAYRDQAFNGPLLVEPVTESGKQWLREWTAEGKALALSGSAITLADISNHFIGLNTVGTPYGLNIFRYQDPLTIASLGASLSAQQSARILGPLSAICGHHGGSHWSLTADWRQKPRTITTESQPQPLMLTKDNLAGAQAYRCQALAQSLADSNGLSHEIVCSWFQQLKYLGAPSEQGLVEAAGLLLQNGFIRQLSTAELTKLQKTGQGVWSNTLEALAKLQHSQDGT